MSAKGAESGLESTIDCQYTYTFITRISFTHGPPRRSAIPLRRLKTKKENAEKERARKRKAVQVIDRTSDLSSAQESKDEAQSLKVMEVREVLHLASCETPKVPA